MKCMQCEESIAGTGCTKNGICGKSGELADRMDKLIASLIELSSATIGCKNEGFIKEMDEHVVDSLFMTLSNTNFDIQRIDAAISVSDSLMKRAGKQYSLFNGDYSVDTYDSNEDLKSLKQLLLFGLKGLAAYYHHAYVLGASDSSVTAFIRKALAAIKKDLYAEELIALNMECGEVGAKAMALLDEYNVKCYGNPEITQVRTGVGKNPGILITGHDLKDLEQLLEQTKGTGIDVYTHGEMLPAHAYPDYGDPPLARLGPGDLETFGQLLHGLFRRDAAVLGSGDDHDLRSGPSGGGQLLLESSGGSGFLGDHVFGVALADHREVHLLRERTLRGDEVLPAESEFSRMCYGIGYRQHPCDDALLESGDAGVLVKFLGTGGGQDVALLSDEVVDGLVQTSDAYRACGVCRVLPLHADEFGPGGFASHFDMLGYGDGVGMGVVDDQIVSVLPDVLRDPLGASAAAQLDVDLVAVPGGAVFGRHAHADRYPVGSEPIRDLHALGGACEDEYLIHFKTSV